MMLYIPNMDKIGGVLFIQVSVVFREWYPPKTFAIVFLCFYIHVAQTPHCNISHNAPLCNRNVHTCAHFCNNVVHCGIFIWYIVGFVRWIYCHANNIDSVSSCFASYRNMDTSSYILMNKCIVISISYFFLQIKPFLIWWRKLQNAVGCNY